MSSGVLEARGLTWTPLGRSRPVLDAVDLRVEPGERVLVAGASGAGKSTLLRALAGVLGEAEAGDLTGRVCLDGEPVRAGDGRVGLLLQDPLSSLVAGRVGRDVAFGLENLGVPREEMSSRVARALSDVGFPYGPSRRTSALSGGEAQRLALAGVLVMRPRVILLDEPTAMLDDESAAQVRRAVTSVVAAREVGLVVVEHRLDRWLQESGLVDRVVVLGDGGSVVADGPADEVLLRCRSELLAAGLWVPGASAPAPSVMPVPSPRVPVVGPEPVLRFERVGWQRRARRGLSIARPAEPAPALTGVDVVVAAGRTTAVRGRSGSGKSSLLGLAAGLDRPSSGRVVASQSLAAGAVDTPHRWSSVELAARVSWVPQRASSAMVGSTVEDCLLATSRALGDDERESVSRAWALLAALGLEGFEQRHPFTLSGGQRRRLALASAVVHAPPVVVLDEPTVGQDRHTWAAVAGLCRGLGEAGTTLLVATHDDDLAHHADDRLTLRAGHVVGEPA